MDYHKEYDEAKEWHRKVCIMGLYHSTQRLNNKGWTLTNTAEYFGVSIGLVSENVKLAKIMDARPELLKSESRQKALDNSERRNNVRVDWDEDE